MEAMRPNTSSAEGGFLWPIFLPVIAFLGIFRTHRARQRGR
jgi:hypothetical protein